MKTVIITLCLICTLATAGWSQDTLKIQGSEKTITQKLRPIDIRELPEVIKQKISGEDYSSWILQGAYETTAAEPEGTRYYVVELKKDDETIRVWFDEEGNKKDD